MKTFLELYDDLSEFRVISKAQRRKMGIRMKRLAKSAAYKKKVEKSKLRVASPEKQKVKAAKMAKQFVLDKFYPKYKEMGMPQRVKIDQLVKVKYGGMIAKLTQKYMKKVKAKELVKVKKAREAKKDE